MLILQAFCLGIRLRLELSKSRVTRSPPYYTTIHEFKSRTAYNNEENSGKWIRDARIQISCRWSMILSFIFKSLIVLLVIINTSLLYKN